MTIFKDTSTDVRTPNARPQIGGEVYAPKQPFSPQQVRQVGTVAGFAIEEGRVAPPKLDRHNFLKGVRKTAARQALEALQPGQSVLIQIGVPGIPNIHNIGSIPGVISRIDRSELLANGASEEAAMQLSRNFTWEITGQTQKSVRYHRTR